VPPGTAVSAATVSAVAAVAAAAISLVNVGLSSLLVGRQQSEQWTRERLPALAETFMGATSAWKNEVFNGDWLKEQSLEDSVLKEQSLEELGLQAFGAVAESLGRLEVYASPATIAAGSALVDSIEDIRAGAYAALSEGRLADYSKSERWVLHWAYGEAHHAFLSSARRDMGLEPPPVPVGLANHRKR
jgi:hypothetical protein